MSKIIERIIAQTGAPELMDVLTRRLTPSDLQSLLLEVYRQRAASVTPKTVLEQYRRSRFVRPANVAPRTRLEFDQIAFSRLPREFEALELSPVSPLGTVSVLGTVDQNNTVTTIRNTEVCSDSTNVLALECAVRRGELLKGDRRSIERVHLCASQRLLRAQVFEGPASFAHFRIFSLCSSGRDEGGFNFETDMLVQHIEYYLGLLEEVVELGILADDLRVAITVFDERRLDLVQAKVLEELVMGRPEIEMAMDQERESGRGYYTTAAFQIFARDRTGEELLLVDGGFTDWTCKLLSNEKERLLISGLGSERLVHSFSL
ncbi:MAG: hypothetical protein GY835_01065 [bacterium]|nr:hypothetical protein [bacterium]